MSFFALPWAVHISDGIFVHEGWLVAGFALIALLAVASAWRIREEEIPRIALLTAAFFVASSIHVKIGPTSVHLLLTGLVGVVLGWRAPLAILIGVTLQALLIPHGGLSTIGVNASIEALPALLVGVLFPLLYAAIQGGHTWLRSLLVVASALLWGGCLVLAVALLLTNPLSRIISWHPDAGLMVSLAMDGPAKGILLYPLTLAGLAIFAIVSAILERRARFAPEFPLGVFLGVLSVLATVLLSGLVLLADGSERWSIWVKGVFLVHLPIALLEGLILGCTLGFLARVKPEMLTSHTYKDEPPFLNIPVTENPAASVGVPARQHTGVMLLLAVGAMLLSANPAWAHRLNAECAGVERAKRQVKIECFYETDDPPAEAWARVVRADGSVLTEGAVDDKGIFVFRYTKAEPLTVLVTAPGGHRAECKITARQLQGPDSPGLEEHTAIAADEDARPSEHGSRDHGATANRLRDLAAGVGLVLAVTAFVMSWINNRHLRRLTALMKGKR